MPVKSAKPSLTSVDRQALGEQLQSGAKRLQITCPFPEVVERVRQDTAKKGAAKDPEDVFGYVHLKTTDINPELGLELPVGNATFAANTKEGNKFIAHRSKLAVPVRLGQKHLGDSAYEVTSED